MDTTEEISRLTAENTELKAQLKTAKEDLQDKEIALRCVINQAKYYLDFFEALNPSKEAFGNATKKMKNRIESNNKARLSLRYPEHYLFLKGA